jgi:hypothetical protein
VGIYRRWTRPRGHQVKVNICFLILSLSPSLSVSFKGGKVSRFYQESNSKGTDKVILNLLTLDISIYSTLSPLVVLSDKRQKTKACIIALHDTHLHRRVEIPTGCICSWIRGK